MTVIDDAYAELVALLAEATLKVEVDGTAYDVPVDNVAAFAMSPVDPPFLEVGPSSDDLLTFDDEGITFGGAMLHAQVLMAVPAGDADVQVTQLNDLILQVVAVVNDSDDFMVSRVVRPGSVEVNGQTYLGTTVEVLRNIDLR